MLLGARQFFERRAAPTPPLPYDAEVEYIESTGTSTGTQYILLGIDNMNTELACDVVCRSLNQNVNDKWVFGDYSNTNSYNFLFGQYRSQFCITVGGTGGGFFYCGTCDGNDHRVRINRDGGIWFDDTLKHEGNVYQTHQTITHNIRLFGGHHTHNPASNYYNLPCRIYSRQCKFWYGNTIVRDMMAVRFTNELGQSEGAMYDRVSGALFRNAGTGAFTIGPDKS